ncbi:Protein CBG22122 [Caenorhabditis briggsae]|uniref:Protein CBG22122 n=1 Tax=Caenorhabditis briggsae TaxID=6238 RepID=A8Y1K6_CAEBR|nr:Protein CBG22122 [Caenorhabditis briggsae]CAP38776.2 Protein CBG22122 [Caenorhabditis briggsae]
MHCICQGEALILSIAHSEILLCFAPLETWTLKCKNIRIQSWKPTPNLVPWVQKTLDNSRDLKVLDIKGHGNFIEIGESVPGLTIFESLKLSDDTNLTDEDLEKIEAMDLFLCSLRITVRAVKKRLEQFLKYARKSIRPRSTSIWQVVSSLDGYTVRKLKDFVQSLIGKRQFGNMVHDLFMETVARIPFEMHACECTGCSLNSVVKAKKDHNENVKVTRKRLDIGEFIATFVGTLCGPLTANGLKAGTINVRYSYTATNKNSIKQVTKLLKSKEYVRYLRGLFWSQWIST